MTISLAALFFLCTSHKKFVLLLQDIACSLKLAHCHLTPFKDCGLSLIMLKIKVISPIIFTHRIEHL